MAGKPKRKGGVAARRTRKTQPSDKGAARPAKMTPKKTPRADKAVARKPARKRAGGRPAPAREARVLDWQLLSTQEHARRRFRTALLPLGTIEAHDSGPVGTDNFIPEVLSRRLAARLEVPYLPVMPYGLTVSLLAYPGSCGLSSATLAAVLSDVGRSLQRNGLENLLVINGHGGNTATLHEAAERLSRETGLHVAVLDWWWEVQNQAAEIFGPGGMGHAAIDEMGTLLGLRPDLSDRVPRKKTPSYYVYKGVRTYPAVRPCMTYDHADDPVDFARLTPEKCARYADVVTDQMEKMIREILAGWNAIGK
jgi:creatinine amidohydrolase